MRCLARRRAGPARRSTRFTSARVLGTPRAGRGAVNHDGGAADWLRRRRGVGQGAGISPDGTLKICSLPLRISSGSRLRRRAVSGWSSGFSDH